MDSFFGMGGPLARSLRGFEHRRSQAGMASEVERAFERGGILAVEAGTGTGKSLAYLVPAIRHARARGERIIVSTATIHLQEQLVHADLPLLANGVGLDFRATLVKGRRNYVCVRKVAEIRAQPSLLPEEGRAAALRTILDWTEDTSDGTLADLGFMPDAELWDEVTSDHDDCLRSRCPDYDRCFFYRARREAVDADVLVVNHALLLADRALRATLGDDQANGVLPDAARLVIDEAHHLEDVTTNAFSARIGARRVERILARLVGSGRGERGLFASLLERLDRLGGARDAGIAVREARRIAEEIRPAAGPLLRDVRAAFSTAPMVPERNLRVTETLESSEGWGVFTTGLENLERSLRDFVNRVLPLLGGLRELDGDAEEAVRFVTASIGAQVGRLDTVASEIRAFLTGSRSLCRWLSAPASGSGVVASFAPIEVGEILENALYSPFETVVLTSATLTVANRFEHFADRAGLARLPREDLRTVAFPSPFPFEDLALLAVASDLPPPDSMGHDAALHQAIAESIEASDGGAFVLFTSHAALGRAHAALAAPLEESGHLVLCQGEIQRHALLARFRADRRAVLFATDSFWEGVDVRGEGLRMVLIARLPFRVPTDPIQEARYEALRAEGRNPFTEYVVPQAVLRLRQGFGRLVRSKEDAGAVVVLDSRVSTRPYGEIFLDSLPPARRAVGPWPKVLSEIERFFTR